MKQPKSIQISIPHPCTEDWSKMTPQQQGRFCDSCQKCVVDFTGFTDEQLYHFFIEHKNQKVCGKFSSIQLNRQINIPPQPHSTLYKWIIAAGLALVLTTMPDDSAFAKTPWVHEFSTHDNPDKKQGTTTATKDSYEIKGYILDTEEQPVIGAKLVFKQNDMEEGRTYTNIDGSFSIIMKKGNYILYASHPGYDLIDIIVVRQKEVEQKRSLSIIFKKFYPVLGMVESKYEWKWEWEYTKIPYMSPPQD